MADKIVINTVEELMAANLQENIIQIEDQFDKQFDYVTKKYVKSSAYETDARKMFGLSKDDIKAADYTDDGVFGASTADFLANEELSNRANFFDIASTISDMSLRSDNINDAAFYAGLCAMGVDCIKKEISESVIANMDSDRIDMLPTEKYEISTTLKNTLEDAKAEIARKNQNAVNELDQNVHFGALSTELQSQVAKKAISAFFDKQSADFLTNDPENPMPVYMRDFYYKAITEGVKYLEAAFEPDDSNTFTPDTAEKQQMLDHLKDLAKGRNKELLLNSRPFHYTILNDHMSLNDLHDQTTKDVVGLINRSQPYRTDDISLDFVSSTVLKNMTPENFCAHVAALSPSYAEQEYSEGVVNKMLNRLYRKDELREIIDAGLNPLEHIYIDGVSAMDITPEAGRMSFRQRLQNSQMTHLDCIDIETFICAAALGGKKIDVCKYTKQANGDFSVSDPISVKTNTEKLVKEKPVSMWRRILRFFGLDSEYNAKLERERAMADHTDTHRQIKERMDFDQLVGNAADNTRRMERANDAENVRKPRTL